MNTPSHHGSLAPCDTQGNRGQTTAALSMLAPSPSIQTPRRWGCNQCISVSELL